MKTSTAVPDLSARCREKGLALTAQRSAVLGELAGRLDHPTADQVYEAVGPKVPGLSRTTVYRVLDTMAKAGVIGVVGSLGAAMRYDPTTGRHHHLMCVECHKVVDFEDPKLDALKVPTGTGFEIGDYSVQFKGTCPECRKKSGGNRRN